MRNCFFRLSEGGNVRGRERIPFKNQSERAPLQKGGVFIRTVEVVCLLYRVGSWMYMYFEMAVTLLLLKQHAGDKDDWQSQHK